ncbi:MAG: peptide ABC transporter substrate-binding protein [Spirochaetaceae bacterium]|jgi:oligopeptide transport system substrate-binding protein|nr:peptide ABC transporter substrate-binding protein [Spirochaetaceae bacterium]
MKKRLFVALAALAALSAIAGCSRYNGDADTIVVVVGSEPNTMDPALNSALDAFVYLAQMFEGLYRYEDDGQGVARLVPGLASGAPAKTLNADGSVVYTYTLRGGLKWSDGKDLTADDIVYSWRRLVDPATAADYNYMINMVKNAEAIMDGTLDKAELGVKALDGSTLEVTLTYDCPFFDEVLSFSATFPVRQDSIERAGDQWTFSPSSYIGNGPYRLKEWVHNSYLSLEKNPYYYKEVTGPDNIRFDLMDDANAILAGFRNNELDFIRSIPVDEVQSLLDTGELQTTDYLAVSHVSFNNQIPPFNDMRVRKAFSLAIDRSYIVEHITRAGQKPAGGIVPYGVEDAEAGSDFREKGGNYYSLTDEDYINNRAEAQKLLAEAGYPGGAGFPVVEYIYNTDNMNQAIAETLQNMWKTVLGVTVTISSQDWAVFLDTRKNGNYQIARDNWIADYNDPITFLELFATGNGNNNPQYSNPRFDALLKQARAMSAQESRMKLFHQAEDILVGEDSSVAPVYFYVDTYLLNPGITGIYYNSLGLFMFDAAKIER